jgi:Protein of unknown function (DUF2892)
MKRNMGKGDRIIRLLLAFVLAILWLQNVVGGPLGVILVLFSGIFFLTSIVGVCPFYTLFGITTYPRKKPS